jgi:hypothetical protein
MTLMLDCSAGSAFAHIPEHGAQRVCHDACEARIMKCAFRPQPIFEMNLPEGVLCERLRLAFAKATV